MIDKLVLLTRHNIFLFIRNASGKRSVRIHGLSVIILIILFYSAFTWLFLSELGNEELSYLLATTMVVIGVLYGFLEILLLATKYTDFSRSVIPRNLLLLPLSSSRMFLLILGDLIFNVNTLCFLGASTIILARVPAAGYLARLIPLGIPLLFSIMVSVWAANLYILTAKYFTRNKHLVMMIPYMLFFALQILMQMNTDDDIFRNIITVPVVGRVLSGTLFAVSRDWIQLVFSVIFLLLISAVGFVAGLVLIRRFRHNFAG